MGNKADKGKKGKPSKAPTLKRFAAPTTDDINKHYRVTDTVLGSGAFSTVKLAESLAQPGLMAAVKIVKKSGVANKPEMLTNEVDILSKVDHPNVITLIDIFDTPDILYLVMELVTGGELFDRIVERESYHEAEAVAVMRQLFDAIKYLHKLDIVHRDLKPENLLLQNETSNVIKVTDFGLSKVYSTEMMSTACGTPSYVAPEVLESMGYDPAVDMWSAGVIMYILLCGYPPFYNENPPLLFEAIMEGDFEFHSPYWDHVSPEAKDLISHLLVVEPSDRLTAQGASEHPWFSISLKGAEPFPSTMHDELQKHNSVRKSAASLIDIRKDMEKSKKKSKKDKEKSSKKKK